MGGYGSGRPSHKQKAEDCRSLDVNRLQREGCLTNGRAGHWVWLRNEEEVGRIGYSSNNGRLNLDYRVRLYGGDWESVSQSICIHQASCHYGGERPYFRCPGIVNGRHCGRRVGKLFSGGKYFLCRHCYNVAYSSQSELRYDRMLRRANKLRTELGGEPGSAHWIAPKPKGMWQRTYQRKRFEIQWCENQADRLFLRKFSHLLSKSEQAFLFD